MRTGSADEVAADAEVDIEKAIADAARLADMGNHDEAIRVLTEANRVRRDARVEQGLVELRSSGFEAMSSPSARPPWPESVVDLFPGELIPEVTPENFTVETLRSAIQNHGSLLVRGLVDEARVGQLVGDIDFALDAFDADAAGADRPDLQPWYQRFARDRISNREVKRKRGSVMTVESPATLFDLVEAFEKVGLDELTREYFGEPPVLLARKCTLRRISHEAGTGGWHQDGAFMGAGIRSLNVWLSLTHCGDVAPGIDVVGRRLDHIVQTGEGAFAEWATNPAAAEKAAEGALVRPIFEPGDALLFDHMNLHRTAIDAGMENDRHAIETWLLAPSTYGAMGAKVDDGYSPRDQVPILL